MVKDPDTFTLSLSFELSDGPDFSDTHWNMQPNSFSKCDLNFQRHEIKRRDF